MLAGAVCTRFEPGQTVAGLSLGRFDAMPGEDATDGWMSLIGAPIDAPALAALVGLRSLRLLPLSSPPHEAVPAVTADAPDSLASAVVGIDQTTVALASACARAGRRLLVLLPDDAAAPADTDLLAWLAALGARVLNVSACSADLARAAPDALARAGFALIDPANVTASRPRPLPSSATGEPVWEPSAEMLTATLGAAEAAGEVLVVSGGRQVQTDLASLLADGRSETLALPFDDVATGADQRAVALVGEPVGDWPAAGRCCSAEPPTRNGVPVTPGRGDMLTVAVTQRESVAMRRLLAREVGLIVTERGAIGSAALVRALFEDRSRRPRERRMSARASALVLVPGPHDASAVGPLLADDVVPQAAVSLADFVASPARCLLLPPPISEGLTAGHTARGSHAHTGVSAGGFHVCRR